MIIGEKIEIIGITKESINDILKWVNNPNIKKYTGTLFPVSDFEHEEWIKRKVSSNNEKLFLLRDKNTQINIGIIGLKNIDYTNRNAEIYISIGNDDFLNSKEKKGYGTDALKTICNFCFDRMNLHKVYLRVFESNERAIRCYKNIGFEIEGRLKEQHFENGKYETEFFMGKISIGE